jgi:NAD(P)-dependent dehydrogenase (short-subunit alcohol dehydrogenase family)
MARYKNFWKYYKQYEVAQIVAMIKNNGRNPLQCTTRFDNKLVVITGTTSGIGYSVAHKYAQMGANLLCINRSTEKSAALKDEIESTYGTKCDYLLADLSKLEEIHRIADELAALDQPIDVLIHNAGIHLTRLQLTQEGYDKVFVVNYLSSFIINFKLVDKLKSQQSARIIMNNSEGHRFAPWGLLLDDLNWTKRNYSGLKAYGSAKLAQLLSMHLFQELFAGSKVTINSMHPGAVQTSTGKENGVIYNWYKKNILAKLFRPIEISSDALYYLGVSNDLEGISGKFFNLTTPEIPSPPAWDVDEARDLWAVSLKISHLS